MNSTIVLGARYRSLVDDVLSRLPHGWNLVDGKLKDVTFVESDGYPSKATGLAVTEFRPSPFTQMRQRYHRVTLYTRNLSKVSDEVVRSAIAHELGHVVSSHLQRLVNEERAEEIADILAMSWGFAKEWEAWNAANL